MKAAKVNKADKLTHSNMVRLANLPRATIEAGAPHSGCGTSIYSARYRPLSKTKVFYTENINAWYEQNKKDISRQRMEKRNPKYIVLPNLADTSIEEKFVSIANMWKRETMMSSLIAEKITNLNYQTIIGLGITYKEKILQLIFKDLEKGQEYWHYALKSITGKNPVPKGMVNNLSLVRNYWLQWAKENSKL